MKLSNHPFGKAYFHKPSNKVVYLSNPAGPLGSGKWSAHYQYRETLVVHEDDLEFAMQNQIVKDYPNQK